MGVILIGAGNHSKVVIDILNKQGREITGIVDDNKQLHGNTILGVEVIGSSDKVFEFDNKNYELVITIGKPKVRQKIFSNFSRQGYNFINAIHPNSCISKYSYIKTGIIINSGVKLHPDVILEDNIIVGLNSTISHDTKIGAHSHISPGVNLAGEVKVDECVDIGLNSAVIPGKKVGKNSIIGAGAVVVEDIPFDCTAVGVPAKPIKFHKDDKEGNSA